MVFRTLIRTQTRLVPPHSVRNLSPPDIQDFAPFHLHFTFASWGTISYNFSSQATLGGGQRQETVGGDGGILFMENSRPACHHVVLLKIWQLLLLLIIILVLLRSLLILR